MKQSSSQQYWIYATLLFCCIGSFLYALFPTPLFGTLNSLLVLLTLSTLLLFFSPTQFLLGTRNILFDVLGLIGAFFVMGEFVLQRILLFLGSHGFLVEIYAQAVQNVSSLEQYSMLVGAGILLIWSFCATVMLPVKTHSVLGVFDTGIPHGLPRICLRALCLFLCTLFFTFFGILLLYTWLLILVSLPFFATVLFVIMAVCFVKGKFSLHAFNTCMGFFVKKYCAPFVIAFFSKRTVLLGISGLLVLLIFLNIATDIFSLALDYELIFSLVPSSIGSFGTFSAFVIIFANILAWIFLCCIPVYMWYKIACLREHNHPKHHPEFSPVTIALFCSSIIILLSRPIFTFTEKDTRWGLGLSLLPERFVEFSTYTPVFILLFALVVFVIMYFLAQFPLKRFLYLFPLGISTLFVGMYAFFSFRSIFTESIQILFSVINLNASTQSILFAGILGVVIILNAIFYLSGFLFFLYEIFRE